jgi:HSP20 family protein
MVPSIWRTRNSLDDFVERFMYGNPAQRAEADTWAPRVDVNESEDDFTIDVELPGIDKKDIKVDVKDNVLTVSGERVAKKEDNEGCYSCRERHYGKFERSFSVPKTVDVENIKAQYKNGVMTLTLPKSELAKPREIEVEVK